MVATTTRIPNNIYILDMKKREKKKSTQKDSKEEKVPKTKNKDEVLLSATCSGRAAPKKRVTFFSLNLGGGTLPFAIDVKGGDKLVS